MILHGMVSMSVSSVIDFACGRKMIDFILIVKFLPLQLHFEYLSCVHFQDLIFLYLVYMVICLCGTPNSSKSLFLITFIYCKTIVLDL